MIRALLVDDQPLVRAGLRRILEPTNQVIVMGECDDGDEVLGRVGELVLDIIVMDARMRRMNGAEATRSLRELASPPPVLILTTYEDDETVASALLAGARGFILKDAPGEDIIRATTVVANGGSWLDPRVTGRVIDGFRRSAVDAPALRSSLADLTPREVDVARWVARGASNAEVAEGLSISSATVKTHLSHILAKLGLRDRSALIVLGQNLGLG
ncbi:MAG: response regulator transcription factor [Aquihabitans sp.]